MRATLLAVLAASLLLAGCGDEQEPRFVKAYELAMAEEDPVLKIAGLETWLADYPEAEGERRANALREVWRIQVGRHEEAAALAWARTELDSEPSAEGQGTLYTLLFQNAVERGSRESAVQLANQLWESGLVHPSTLNLVGWALVADPGWNVDLGARLAERGVEAAEPGFDRASIMDTAGWGFYLLNRREPALRLLEGAVAELPEPDREISGHLAQLYERIGEEEKLLALWNRMLDLTMDSRVQEKAETLHVKLGGELESFREALWNRRMEKAQDAPDFELSDLQGRPHRLSDYHGKVVMLNFWHPT